MGMILRIASSRIVGQGDIVGRSGYFSLNLSANSVMRGRLDARRTLKSLVADLRIQDRSGKPERSRHHRQAEEGKVGQVQPQTELLLCPHGCRIRQPENPDLLLQKRQERGMERIPFH